MDSASGCILACGHFGAICGRSWYRNAIQVTFVIPTRNQARFLRRAIDSCLAQGIARSEVVVVDGASTDGTQEILRTYGDRIRWTSEPDSGQADAVNKGVARARGEIIAWLNSDDFYPEASAVPSVVAAFETDPHLDLVYGEAVVVDEQGDRLFPYGTPDVRNAHEILIAPQGPSQPATFFRRELFAEVGGLRTDLHYVLDYELWLRLFPRARKVARSSRVLAHMTSHRDAKSVRTMRQQIREVARTKRMAARGFGLSAGERLRMERGIALHWWYWLGVRLGLRRIT